jgi:hypothetical protein
MNADKPSQELESSWRPVALGIAIVGGVLAAVLRIVPHPPNFSAVGSLGIFGGARLRTWQAYLLPLGIMILSDLTLWVATWFNPLYSLTHPSRFFVYGSFMFYVFIGRCIQKKDSLVSVGIAATLGGLQFFVITNFGEWLVGPLYSRDWSGLAACFISALGFYRQETPAGDYPFMVVTNFPMALLIWTILGDVLFTSIYILVHRKLAQRVPQTEPIPLPVSNA